MDLGINITGKNKSDEITTYKIYPDKINPQVSGQNFPGEKNTGKY